MLKVISSLFVFLVFGLVSCKRSVGRIEYIKYVTDKDNGLKKVIELDGWEYSMQYRPNDYIILMETQENRNTLETKKRRDELDGSVWFNISIKRVDNSVSLLKYGVRSLAEYNERLAYYLNQAQQDITLTCNADTLHPISYLFENNYNLTPQETMVIGFILPHGTDVHNGDMRLSFIDRIFKNGIVNATFSAKAIKNIPTLKYKK